MARINSEGGCRCCRSWTHGSVCVPVVVHHGTERCGGGRGRGTPRFIRDEFSSKGFQQSMFQHIFFLLDDCYFVVFHNFMRLIDLCVQLPQLVLETFRSLFGVVLHVVVCRAQSFPLVDQRCPSNCMSLVDQRCPSNCMCGLFGSGPGIDAVGESGSSLDHLSKLMQHFRCVQQRLQVFSMLLLCCSVLWCK